MKVVVDMDLFPLRAETIRAAGIEAVHWSSVEKSSAKDREILACAAGTAAAQGFSSRPITLYLPFVKTGTPRPLVEQYAKAITEALRVPEIAKRLNEIGLEVAGGTPEEFQKTLLDDRNRWAPIAKHAGIKLD